MTFAIALTAACGCRKNYVTPCDLGILVDQAAKPVPAQNAHTSHFHGWMRSPCGRVLMQRPVWPMKVIVIHIFAQDQPWVPGRAPAKSLSTS